MLQCNSVAGIKKAIKLVKTMQHRNNATIQQCYRNQRITKAIKLVKQSNAATMLHCNSATGITQQ